MRNRSFESFRIQLSSSLKLFPHASVPNLLDSQHLLKIRGYSWAKSTDSDPDLVRVSFLLRPTYKTIALLQKKCQILEMCLAANSRWSSKKVDIRKYEWSYPSCTHQRSKYFCPQMHSSSCILFFPWLELLSSLITTKWEHSAQKLLPAFCASSGALSCPQLQPWKPRDPAVPSGNCRQSPGQWGYLF